MFFHRFSLNLDIVIIGFKPLDSPLLRFLQCPQETHNPKKCRVPYLKFQNIYFPFLKKSRAKQKVYLHFNEEIFFVHSPNINPILTNLPLANKSCHATFSITKKNIENILQCHQEPLGCSVMLHALPNYSPHTSRKKLLKHVIGTHTQAGKPEILHILLTPHLNSNDFGLSVIPWQHPINTLPVKNCKKNFLTVPHMMEGVKIESNSPKTIDDSVLNQEFCICEQDSLPYFNPKELQLQGDKLASRFFQTTLLYENLEAVGLLSDSLRLKLKICSLISYVSYDTESLNKTFFDQLDIDNNLTFDNAFQSVPTSKINTGVQKLYIIGKPIHISFFTRKYPKNRHHFFQASSTAYPCRQY